MVNADLRSAEVIRRLRGIDYPSVAEIGVYEGEMSRRLLYRLNLHLLMVDAWDADAYIGKSDPMSTMTEEQWAKVEGKAIANVSWAADRVRIFAGTSQDAAEHYTDDKFDLVFIDGDHSEAATAADIEAWWPKVADGGWLGGHDYGRPEFGVTEAVNDFAEVSGATVELGQNYTWWVRKSD